MNASMARVYGRPLYASPASHSNQPNSSDKHDPTVVNVRLLDRLVAVEEDDGKGREDGEHVPVLLAYLDVRADHVEEVELQSSDVCCLALAN